MLKSLKKIFEGNKKFGKIISEPINTITLTIVYLIGIGIPSIAGKISGKEFLNLKLDKNKESYWQELNLSSRVEDLYKQF